MTLHRCLLVTGLALSLLVFVPHAEAAKKAKKKDKPLTGVVVDVKKDSDKDEGTITIKTKGNKKKGTQGEEKKITVRSSTKFEVVSGKKGAKTETPSSFKELKKDAHVKIVAKGDAAEKVDILQAKKAKKKKKDNA